MGEKVSNQTELSMLADMSAGPSPAPPPPFEELLRHPTVQDPLPDKFDVSREAAHLGAMWEALPALRRYAFQDFVHAGGSGMVFKVALVDAPENFMALKVARAYLVARDKSGPDSIASFSPVSASELKALVTVSHQNIVRLHEAIEFEGGVVAIVTSYIEHPRPLDGFLEEVLSKDPGKGVEPFSPERVDGACSFLVERVGEIASALTHLHEHDIIHFDVKPANILIGESRSEKPGSKKEYSAILTDLGSCVHLAELSAGTHIRVNFTWTYAHPGLTTLTSKPSHISGGGLRVSAELPSSDELAKYDLYALGRTIQRSLAILLEEFGEGCFAAYGFRFLHMVACLLLDGHNAPATNRSIDKRDGLTFVDDCAMEYHYELFGMHRIQTARDLAARLKRFTREYSVFSEYPELDPWQPSVVNAGVGGSAPLTPRVAAVLGHPALRRLKSEFQLGWMREVYPGATHNRWSHTIGVFSAVVAYYNSLLADPDVPTLSLLADDVDLAHAMVASLLHDIGQTDFAHDLESACPKLFDHEGMIRRLVDDQSWGKQGTLRCTIEASWPRVDMDRVFSILGLVSEEKRLAQPGTAGYRPIDGVARDILDGPVDADKFDYLQRDSVACGVSYGVGIDRPRFLSSLTVDVKEDALGPRLALAYRAKGAASVESLLLARYQMYNSVYWHHTYRCIQAMFAQAVADTFGNLGDEPRRLLRGKQVHTKTVSDMLYHRVVCAKPIEECVRLVGEGRLPAGFKDIPPADVAAERALEIPWRFADVSNRHLLEDLARRRLYKRVFELRLGDQTNPDYSAMRELLQPYRRPDLASKIANVLLDAVNREMQSKAGAAVETVSEFKARERHQELQAHPAPLVVLDFPVRGIPDEHNVPHEIADSARKYISGYGQKASSRQNVFNHVRAMQVNAACLRIFVEPRLHELVIRYLNPSHVRKCIEAAIPQCRNKD